MLCIYDDVACTVCAPPPTTIKSHQQLKQKKTVAKKRPPPMRVYNIQPIRGCGVYCNPLRIYLFIIPNICWRNSGTPATHHSTSSSLLSSSSRTCRFAVLNIRACVSNKDIIMFKLFYVYNDDRGNSIASETAIAIPFISVGHATCCSLRRRPFLLSPLPSSPCIPLLPDSHPVPSNHLYIHS